MLLRGKVIESLLSCAGDGAGGWWLSGASTAASGVRFATAVDFVVLSAAVLAGFRTGDADAVRAVYQEFGRLVFAVAHRTLGSRELAEEATQLTFVKAWQGAAGFDESRPLGPWLATIARRTAIDVHRREARRRGEPLGTVAGDDPSVIELPPSVDRAYDVWSVRQAIDELPPDEREVMRLQHLEELTQVEVAARLGLSVGTVKSRSFRAHRRLATKLGHLRAVGE
jgi:RNA polymerase sigma-70 factor (ECF subfamily)